MTAILFGSISTIADTSELQRAAFNRAFESHGLSWRWEQEEYRSLLVGSGGEQRIADYADKRGEDVDAGAVHKTKSELFQASLADADLRPREGVVETIAAARGAGMKVGFASLTSADNIDALFAALGQHLTADDFDLVLNSRSAAAPKPDPAGYTYAVLTLGERPGDCVAVEDNVPGAQAAVAAGLNCIAFPNENTADHDFGAAPRVEQIEFAQLQQLAHGA